MAEDDDDKKNADELAAELGYASAFFNTDPELRKLLDKAVKENWSTAQFQAKFMATRWYRSHEASVREWVELNARDPAEVKSRIADQVFKVKNLASQMGIRITGSRLEQIAKDSLRFGFPDDQLEAVLAAEWKYRSGGTSGFAADLETQIKQTAYSYGVSVSARQLQDWISGVMSNKYDESTLDDYVRDIARGKYKGLRNFIDAGMTTRQIAAPYLTSYANLLEQSEDTVSLDDPLLAQALQGRQQKDGQFVSQSLYDFETSLRKDPRWLKTKNAREQTTNLGLKILQDMGLMS